MHLLLMQVNLCGMAVAGHFPLQQAKEKYISEMVTIKHPALQYKW